MGAARDRRIQDRRGGGAALRQGRGEEAPADGLVERGARLLPHRDGVRGPREFRILFLDKKNGLIADEMQRAGTVDHTPVYPREVVKRALELSATAIMLVHNHPTRPTIVTLDHVQCR